MQLVFDIGATNTRLAFVRSGRLLHPVEFRTPKGFQIGLKKIAEYVGKQKLSGIAGCLPGHKDLKTKKWGKLRNLSGWAFPDLEGELRRRFRCPVYSANDVELAALGEARRGAGRGKAIVAYLTVSSGINGARVVDGKLDRRTWGWSIGRQMISADSDLESKVSGAGLYRRFGRPAEKIHDTKVWAEVHRQLTLGLFNAILFWSPEVLVLGGGMVGARAIKLPKLNAELWALKTRMKSNVPLPPLVPSKLGQLAGLYGGVEYLNNR
ncbi:MAG: ROK family protein [Patescibacteria group bacterium]|nr:ROK family protein [Patescibacteria group bacterium]